MNLGVLKTKASVVFKVHSRHLEEFAYFQMIRDNSAGKKKKKKTFYMNENSITFINELDNCTIYEERVANPKIRHRTHYYNKYKLCQHKL